MDKNKYEEYEKVHAKLVEAMWEACTKDEAGPYDSPEVDLSFLYEDIEEEPKPKRFKCSRFGKVAAIVIIALLSLNVVMMATGSGESYSDNGLLHRIFEGARGIFTDGEDAHVEIDETGETYIIDSYGDLNDGKDIWEDIYIPQYIPNGFKFHKLEIRKSISGGFCAEYTYLKQDLEIKIYLFDTIDNEHVLSGNIGDFIECEDRIINIYSDVATNMNVADIYVEDIIITIYSSLNKNEIIKIAKQLEK